MEASSRAGRFSLDVDCAVQDPDDRGIINIRSLVRIGIGDVPTEELIKYLDSLVETGRVKELNVGSIVCALNVEDSKVSLLVEYFRKIGCLKPKVSFSSLRFYSA